MWVLTSAQSLIAVELGCMEPPTTTFPSPNTSAGLWGWENPSSAALIKASFAELGRLQALVSEEWGICTPRWDWPTTEQTS